MNAGDKVLYVPHSIHARERNHMGDFPWVVGLQARPPRKDSAGNVVDDGVEELTPGQLALKLGQISKMPHAARPAESTKLIYLRPAAAWDAVVVKVYQDKDGNDVCDLDVASGSNGGITLHYKGVPMNEMDKQPHSCHSKLTPGKPAKGSPAIELPSPDGLPATVGISNVHDQPTGDA